MQWKQLLLLDMYGRTIQVSADNNLVQLPHTITNGMYKLLALSQEGDLYYSRLAKIK